MSAISIYIAIGIAGLTAGFGALLVALQLRQTDDLSSAVITLLVAGVALALLGFYMLGRAVKISTSFEEYRRKYDKLNIEGQRLFMNIFTQILEEIQGLRKDLKDRDGEGKDDGLAKD